MSTGPNAVPQLAHVITGEGPPVLLLHGLGGDRRQSLGLLPEVPHFTRIAPDLPGHGDTDLAADEPVGFGPFATRIGALLDMLMENGSLPARPLPVAGVSMGAGCALTLAAQRPDLVQSLVLIRPSWLGQSPAPNLAPFELVACLLEKYGPQAGEAAFMQTCRYRDVADVAPAMAESLLGQFRRPLAQERARVLARMPHSLPLPDRQAYERLEVDTLVLVAPEDPVHPWVLGCELALWLPHARVGMLPRKLPDPTTHALAIQRAVSSFLTATESSC